MPSPRQNPAERAAVTMTCLFSTDTLCPSRSPSSRASFGATQCRRLPGCRLLQTQVPPPTTDPAPSEDGGRRGGPAWLQAERRSGQPRRPSGASRQQRRAAAGRSWRAAVHRLGPRCACSPSARLLPGLDPCAPTSRSWSRLLPHAVTREELDLSLFSLICVLACSVCVRANGSTSSCVLLQMHGRRYQ